MKFKIRLPKLKLHMRSVIAIAFVALVCVAAYADSRLSQRRNNREEYLYTSASAEQKEDKQKILGEATFVDKRETTVDAGSEDGTADGSYDSYFTAMQVDRQRSRDEAYNMLRNVVDSAESMPDVKEKAYNEMIEIADNLRIESNIRSMVMAKGFDECLAVINGENLNVIVSTNGLLVNEVAKIKEIAVNESGLPAENVKVIEKNNR